MTAFFRGPSCQSATWHQISWSEADAAPFPGWCVPGAISWSHGFYRWTNSCGKSQQRYMDIVWFHCSSVTQQNYPLQPWLCIPFIVIYHTILLLAHMKPFSFIIMYAGALFHWRLSFVSCSFCRDTSEEPGFNGPADQRLGKQFGNLPSPTKWQGPVCGKNVHILLFFHIVLS